MIAPCEGCNRDCILVKIWKPKYGRIRDEPEARVAGRNSGQSVLPSATKYTRYPTVIGLLSENGKAGGLSVERLAEV